MRSWRSKDPGRLKAMAPISAEEKRRHCKYRRDRFPYQPQRSRASADGRISEKMCPGNFFRYLKISKNCGKGRGRCGMIKLNCKKTKEEEVLR